MAGLRPFRGLRYTRASEDLGALLAPPSVSLTPTERAGFAVRDPHNVVALASPEGSGDDRSKFVRYARGAARLAEWRREGLLSAEEVPAFYRLTQWIGTDRVPRATLFAIAAFDALRTVTAVDPRVKDERLRILEATRTSFEPAIAFYEDPRGALLSLVRAAPAASETAAELDGAKATFETIRDPETIAELTAAFEGRTLWATDEVEAVEAAREFGASGAFVALASFDDGSYARLPIHRVLRRLLGGQEAALAKLATLFEIEDHHSRNLAIHLDRAVKEGRTVFGMATEGGFGYLLTPRTKIEGSPSAWLSAEVFGRLLGSGEADATLTFTDPVQAIRATNEGAAAAFILPTPPRDEIREAARSGGLLPAHAAQTYPAVPTGLVFWSQGDDD